LKNNIYSVLGMALLFVIVQVIAIAIAPIYSEASGEAMGGRETIEDPSFAFLYLGIILLFTFFILWIAKRKKEKFIKILILAAIFMTMTYLFVPLTIIAMYPPSEDVWGFNDIGQPVVALNAGDIDDDGIIEVVAGCFDNRTRIYETENHTLEWESDDLDGNITQILITNLDSDSSNETVVLSDGITVFDGITQSEEWSNSSLNFTSIAIADLNNNGTPELIAGTNDSKVLIFEAGMLLSEMDFSSNLSTISFLSATDDGRIVIANSSIVALLNPTTPEIELEITELNDIRALTVYQNPEGEDNLIVATNKRCFLFDLPNEDHLRDSEYFTDKIDLPDIKDVQIDYYSIPDYSDSIPEVIVVDKRAVFIYPDLLKSEGYYWLEFDYDLHAFLSTDLEEDGTKDIIIGIDEGYKYTPITFGEGPNYILPIVISIIIALSLTIFVHKYPEWYVVDAVGLVMAIGATVILGVTFAISVAIVLLIILALYDAISVYKTKHMISLADSVIDLNLPVLLVIPKKLGYSYRKKKPRLKEQLESGKEREAMFMGLGDLVIPSILIVSSMSFLSSFQTGVGIASNVLVAIGTMIGILVGFSILMRYVMKGNPQAGLPLLNSGAILGYIFTYILVYGDFTFGFV
jgi:presenilin-like A22 family membrane protease